MAKSFRDFFDKDENKETVKDILRAVRLDQSEEEQGDTLGGNDICNNRKPESFR